MKFSAIVSIALLSASVVGCGGRPERWETPFVRGTTVGLQGSVAMVDEPRNEVMMLTSPAQNQLAIERLRVGRNIVAVVPSGARDRLFVLSGGVQRRLHQDDEKPQLFVISGGTEPQIETKYELSGTLQKLALDPRGEWVVAYDAGGVVVNVNELMLVHVAEPDEAPIPITIHSTGGQPQRFTFTDPLTLPSGETRRLLVVETDQDVAIIDLADPQAREFTVPMPKTQTGATAQPAGVVFHDTLPGNDVASYLAVRFANDSNVLTLRLGAPAQGSPSAFLPIPNIVDAGGQPSTIEFVETGQAQRGLRLAALVPARRVAVLFDPATSKSETVQFSQAYSGIARVTSFVDEPSATGDVALLFSDSVPSIAFWRLGFASSTPYASFEEFSVDNRVSSVLDVPGTAFAHLKLLTSAQNNEFFLLDLKSRQSHPMRALLGYSLELSPDGRRAWAFQPNATEFAQLNFENKHPMTLQVERPIFDVFDIAQGRGSGRTALVLHDARTAAATDGSDDVAVTLFDALEPDSANTRFVSGLILEGWR